MKSLSDRIQAIGPVIPGTIREVRLRCGHDNCACTSGREADKHGPYYFWAFKKGKRPTTVSLREDEVPQFQAWVDNRRQLEALVEELLQEGVRKVLAGRKK